jgi:hypothetical protein
MLTIRSLHAETSNAVAATVAMATAAAVAVVARVEEAIDGTGMTTPISRTGSTDTGRKMEIQTRGRKTVSQR